MTPADRHDPPDEVDDAVETDKSDQSAEGDAVPAADSPEDDEPAWVRRRRLDAVFGDGAHGQALGDRWYRDQVPPHHG